MYWHKYRFKFLFISTFITVQQWGKITLTCTQTIIDIRIEKKTYHPLRGNLCLSLLCLLDFFLPLLSAFVTLTLFSFTKYQQIHPKFTVVFWGWGINRYWNSVSFLWYLVSSYGFYKLGYKSNGFLGKVCCIPCFNSSIFFNFFLLLKIEFCLFNSAGLNKLIHIKKDAHGEGLPWFFPLTLLGGSWFLTKSPVTQEGGGLEVTPNVTSVGDL